MAKLKKPRLGRGLSSLMSMPVSVEPPARSGSSAPENQPEDAPPTPHHLPSAAEAASESTHSALVWIAVDRIQPNPFQPRQAIDQEGLEELASSIRQDGLMQPVAVRTQSGNGDYQLIAGERRWRAAMLAGLKSIPAVVHELDDQQLAEWALIENLQREDLNPIERAHAFTRLIEQFGLSHDQVADRVGISRPNVTNILRLMELSAETQELIRVGVLSAGHGRALLGLSDHAHQIQVAKRAVAAGWSVRMIEQAVRRLSEAPSTKGRGRRVRSANTSDLEKQISAQLNTNVRITTGRKKGSGTLSIDFYDLDQFDALLQKLGVSID